MFQFLDNAAVDKTSAMKMEITSLVKGC